jgi:hypothetical protein
MLGQGLDFIDHSSIRSLAQLFGKISISDCSEVKRAIVALWDAMLGAESDLTLTVKVTQQELPLTVAGVAPLGASCWWVRKHHCGWQW